MTVMVYGATGFTGRLVCEALARRGLAFGVAGRNRARVEALAAEVGAIDARAAELWDFEQLVAALANAKVVVNCCGPFRLTGEVVMRAALAVGAHYLDTTGEQAFMRDVYERYESEVRRAGLCFVNGFAFEVALGDWAAALAASALGDGALDEIVIAYAINDFHPSRGTQLSALGQMSEPGVVWETDRWDPAKPAAEKRTFGFPPPFGDRSAISFPSGEVITVPRHVPTRRVQTYISLPPGLLSIVVSRTGRLLGPLARSPLTGVLRRRVVDAPEPTRGQRGVNDFAVTATATRGFETAHVAVTGTDVYGCTAEVVALGADQLLAGTNLVTGLLAPSQAFDPTMSLASLPIAVTTSFPPPPSQLRSSSSFLANSPP